MWVSAISNCIGRADINSNRSLHRCEKRAADPTLMIKVLVRSVLQWETNSVLNGMAIDMKRFSANNFCHAFYGLVELHTKLLATKDISRLPGEDESKIFYSVLKDVYETCEGIGLKVCAAMASFYGSKKAHPIKSYESLRAATQSLVVAMSREIDTEVFFRLPPDTVELFSEKPAAIFGEEVQASFPSASEDIQEAANCFCLERWPASVFHLMRVLERGLAALGVKFGVPTCQKNWHNSIQQIESKIRTIDKNWGNDWKEQQKIYSNIASHFMFLKDAWRNHVMHASDVYDKGKAGSAFQHTREFMQEIAKHLKEVPIVQP